MASYKNIFKITHNDVLPIQGSILIAEPFLQDAYFQRSVVLLIEHTHKVEVLAGAFMLLRHEALDKVGLLDESFFMYGEDIDLSYRIVLVGDNKL